MKPTRRVLLAIGVLVLTMAAGLLVSWHLQTRALGAALATEVQARLGRAVERTPGGAPKHENGYACFVKALEAMPADLAPFDLKSGGVLEEMMDAGVVVVPWLAQVASLEPWAEATRSCGDSRRLAFVPGVTPFSTVSETLGERGSVMLLALSRVTRLQARMESGQPEVIAERCAATLELALDHSHVNLIGAMVAGATVRHLTPSCGEALQRVGPESRPALAARMERLRERLVSNHEWVDSERLAMSLALFGWTLSEAQRARLPAGDDMMRETLANPLHRFVIARVWGRWDRAMRQLAANADAPGPARLEASLQLDEVFDEWWIPGELSVGGPSYEKLLVRNEETGILLQVLAGLASGDDSPLPLQVTRETEGLVFTNFEGVRMIIPQR